MDTNKTITVLTQVIQKSDLDQTIKDIMIRDLQREGLTEFLLEQIKAFCNVQNVEELIHV